MDCLASDRVMAVPREKLSVPRRTLQLRSPAVGKFVIHTTDVDHFDFDAVMTG